MTLTATDPVGPVQASTTSRWEQDDTATSKDGTTIAFDTRAMGPPVVVVGGALNTRRPPRHWRDSSPRASRSTPTTAEAAATAATRRRTRSSGRSRTSRRSSRTRAEPRSRSVTRPARARARVALETPGITKLVLYEPPFIVDDSRPPLPDDYVAHLKALADGSPGRRRRVLHDHGRRRAAEAIPSMRELPFWPSLEALAHTLWYDG